MMSRAGQKRPAAFLTDALGAISLGLGLAELLAPQRLAQVIGVRKAGIGRRVLRGIGAREVASGLGIFTGRWPAGWLWGRVAGDALDLTLLGRQLRISRKQRNRVLAALAAVAGIAVLDLAASVVLTRSGIGFGRSMHGMHLRKAITVNRPPEEVYGFWRDFRNLPRFMPHLETVEAYDDRRSHWKTQSPLGTAVEWDAEITEDRANEMIAWRSLPGADVDNQGTVNFRPAPGNRGTEVTVEMRYDVPGGAIGKTVSALFQQDPDRQVYDALRSFKSIMETGDVLYSDSSVHGHPYPAQPAQGDRS